MELYNWRMHTVLGASEDYSSELDVSQTNQSIFVNVDYFQYKIGCIA